jgi:hypothetical protein
MIEAANSTAVQPLCIHAAGETAMRDVRRSFSRFSAHILAENARQSEIIVAGLYASDAGRSGFGLLNKIGVVDISHSSTDLIDMAGMATDLQPRLTVIQSSVHTDYTRLAGTQRFDADGQPAAREK